MCLAVVLREAETQATIESDTTTGTAAETLVGELLLQGVVYPSLLVSAGSDHTSP